MNYKNVFLYLVIILTLSQVSNAQYSLSNAYKFTEIKLQPRLAYDGFTANEQYLAWLELYKQEVFVFDLEKKSLDKIKLTKGRGPYESLTVSAIGITNNNKLILNDVNNVKFIIYDLNTGSFTEEIKFDSKRLMKISVYDATVFSLGIRDKNSLYHIIDGHKNWSSSKVNMGAALNVNKRFSNIYKKDGYIASNNLYGIHVAKYYPSVFIVDLKKGNFLREIKYDQTEKINYENKKELIDVEFETEDVTFVPESSNLLALLANGKGENSDYSLEKLKILNIKNREFEGILEPGMKVNNIASNSNHLFLYSKDENSIFSYEVVKN